MRGWSQKTKRKHLKFAFYLTVYRMQIALLGSKSPYLFMYWKIATLTSSDVKLKKRTCTKQKLCRVNHNNLSREKALFYLDPAGVFTPKATNFFSTPFNVCLRQTSLVAQKFHSSSTDSIVSFTFYFFCLWLEFLLSFYFFYF